MPAVIVASAALALILAACGGDSEDTNSVEVGDSTAVDSNGLTNSTTSSLPVTSTACPFHTPTDTAAIM